MGTDITVEPRNNANLSAAKVTVEPVGTTLNTSGTVTSFPANTPLTYKYRLLYGPDSNGNTLRVFIFHKASGIYRPGDRIPLRVTSTEPDQGFRDTARISFFGPTTDGKSGTWQVSSTQTSGEIEILSANLLSVSFRIRNATLTPRSPDSKGSLVLNGTVVRPASPI